MFPILYHSPEQLTICISQCFVACLSCLFCSITIYKKTFCYIKSSNMEEYRYCFVLFCSFYNDFIRVLYVVLQSAVNNVYTSVLYIVLERAVHNECIRVLYVVLESAVYKEHSTRIRWFFLRVQFISSTYAYTTLF